MHYKYTAHLQGKEISQASNQQKRKLETVCSSKMSVNFYKTHSHIAEDKLGKLLLSLPQACRYLNGSLFCASCIEHVHYQPVNISQYRKEL
jgi:hypothetical protein